DVMLFLSAFRHAWQSSDDCTSRRHVLAMNSFSTHYAARAFAAHPDLLEPFDQFVTISPSFGLSPLSPFLYKILATLSIRKTRRILTNLGALKNPIYTVLFQHDVAVSSPATLNVAEAWNRDTAVEGHVILGSGHDPFHNSVEPAIKARIKDTLTQAVLNGKT